MYTVKSIEISTISRNTAFLKNIDNKIPNVRYKTNSKFVCGIVLDINGITYYVPISHITSRKRTSLQIKQDDRILSTIRFSFMFPAINDVLTEKDFTAISLQNPGYASLLEAEYRFCRTHERQIKQKALYVYQIGCNKNHVLNYTCCDFKKLEQHFMEFFTQN